jgi:hypothetical protein
MAEARSRLHREMREVVQDASSATDWRTYVRSRPWLAIGAAFGVGYFLVPARHRRVTYVEAPSTTEVALQPAGKTKSSLAFSALKWALMGLGPIALRAAQSYAVNHVEDLLARYQFGGPASVPPGGGPRPSPAWGPRAEGR